MWSFTTSQILDDEFFLGYLPRLLSYALHTRYRVSLLDGIAVWYAVYF